MRDLFKAPQRWAPAIFVVLGFLWATVAALDPQQPSGTIGGPLLALLACLVEKRSSGHWRRWALPLVLTVSFALGARAEPDLYRADVCVYYSYLRSLAFDHDLEFSNEYALWSYNDAPITQTGHRLNQGSIGPSFFWAPFFGLAHVYALGGRALGFADYAPDGFSTPYFRSMLPATLTVAIVGAWSLASAMAQRVRPQVAGLAVLGAVLTSPVLFYAFVQPGMAHGIAFGLAAAALGMALRVERSPSLRGWIILGALTGLLTLVRFQAVCFAVVPVAVALRVWHRQRRFSWIAAGAAAALAAVLPQIAAWLIIYGSPLVVGPGMRESGGAWFHLTSPRFVSVLISADHGFFSWTPGMLVGVVALMLGWRRWGVLSVAGVLTLLVTAWVNGALVGWNGSDAFGARRFDLIVPFAALGFATLLEAAISAPLAVPAAVIGFLCVWNIGFMALWRQGAFPKAAPATELFTHQAKLAHDKSKSWLGSLIGPYGRSLAYDYFVGRYFFWSDNRNGQVDLAQLDRSVLTGAWSAPRNAAGFPEYRQITGPGACVRLPLLDPLDLPLHVDGRARPSGVLREARVTVNGHLLGRWAFGNDWQGHELKISRPLLYRGENLVCLEFDASHGQPVADIRDIRFN